MPSLTVFIVYIVMFYTNSPLLVYSETSCIKDSTYVNVEDIQSAYVVCSCLLL